MQKDKNKSTEKNRKIQTTTAIEEIAQILYDGGRCLDFSVFFCRFVFVFLHKTPYC